MFLILSVQNLGLLLTLRMKLIIHTLPYGTLSALSMGLSRMKLLLSGIIEMLGWLVCCNSFLQHPAAVLIHPGGASDPGSGTAVLVELSKAFGELLQQGWKPKRTMYISPRGIL